MKDDDKVDLTGTVTEVLPNAMFKVHLDDFDKEILGYISGKMRKNNINVYGNDRVNIECSVHDLSKGRITFRYKK